MGFRAFSEDLKTAKGENIPQRRERTQGVKAGGHCSRNKGQTAAPLTEPPVLVSCLPGSQLLGHPVQLFREKLSVAGWKRDKTQGTRVPQSSGKEAPSCLNSNLFRHVQ